jgi:hypothetical protein
VCSKLPGSAQIAFCQPPVGATKNGQACTASLECQSGLCVDQVCRQSCLHAGSCTTPGFVCRIASNAVAIVPACLPLGGLSPPGDSCEDIFSGPDATLCGTGHCDALAPTTAPCANLCRTRSDCQPTQQCGLLQFAAQTAPDPVPYSATIPGNYFAAAMGCYSPAVPPGLKADGQVCTADGDCQSAHCFQLVSGQSTKYCTRFCTTSAQCGGSLVCRLDVTAPVSEWLTYTGVDVTGKSSLVRVCRFP